jgi:hypothetical protein
VRRFVISQPTPEADVSAATNSEAIAAHTGLTCVGVPLHGTHESVRTLDLIALA